MTQATSVFGLETIDHYLDVAQQAVTEFAADKANVLRCFSALLVLNHIGDWLVHKLSPAEKIALALVANTQPAMRHLVEAENADLTLVRELANGFKHLKGIDPTGKIAGFGQGPYGIGPYDMAFLLIDRGGAPEERWIVADELTSRVLAWWKTRLGR